MNTIGDNARFAGPAVAVDDRFANRPRMVTSSRRQTALAASAPRQGRALLFASGAVLTAVLALATQLLMERGLGPAGFARWALCSALVTFFGALATFGLNSLMLADHFRGRLVSAAGRRAVQHYALACTGLATAAMVVIYAAAPFRVERTALEVAMAAALVALMLPVTAAYAVFQIGGRDLAIAYWPVLQNLARFAAALAALGTLLQASEAIAIWLGCLTLLALWGLHGLARAPALLSAGPPPAAMAGAADSALPAESAAVADTGRRARRFGWMEFLDALDLKVALPIAALFLADLHVAAVGLGMLLINAIYYFPYVILMRYLLPAVHRADAAGGGLPRVTDRLDRIGLLASLVTGLALAWGAPAAVAWVATGDYSAQHGMFIAVGVATVPLVMSTLGAGPFLGERHAGQLLKLRAVSTMAFLVALLALVGPLGAAAPFVALAAGRGWLWWALWRWRRRLTAAQTGVGR